MMLKKIALAAMTALAAFATQAAPVLSLTASGSGGNASIQCADGAACDLNPLAGVVTFIGQVGGFLLNVSTGAGNGSAPIWLMDLNSVNTQITSGTNTLVLGFSDTGYTHIGDIVGSWGGTLTTGAGTITASAYAGTTNTLFENSLLLGTLGPFASSPYAGSFTAASPATGPYSLSQYITLNTTGAFGYSGDFELKVPEPNALALVGLALVAGAVVRRRRA